MCIRIFHICIFDLMSKYSLNVVADKASIKTKNSLSKNRNKDMGELSLCIMNFNINEGIMFFNH